MFWEININICENVAFLCFVVKKRQRKISVSNDDIDVHHVILTNYEQALPTNLTMSLETLLEMN